MEIISSEEIITPSSRRRGYSERVQILKEHTELGLSVSSLARKYGIHPVTIYHWKRTYMKNKSENKNEISTTDLLAELEKVRQENVHLKKALAEVSVDKSILKDAVEILKN